VPKAFGQKFHYLDHDTDERILAPPVLNQWYEIFHAYDVRLLWCILYQTNVEAAAKNLEMRWTIDGTVYFGAIAAADSTVYWGFRDSVPSAGGTAGLGILGAILNSAYFIDKRGQDFKVEVRITSALGTNQTLMCRCVRETLELT